VSNCDKGPSQRWIAPPRAAVEEEDSKSKACMVLDFRMPIA